MQIIHHALPEKFHLILTSDWHHGSAMKHADGIMRVIDAAKAKNTYMIHGGDLIEGIAVDDPRYDMNTIDPKAATVLRQYQDAADELKPVAHKILGIHEGNHDIPALKYGNFVRDIVCKTLGVPFATYSARYLITDASGKTRLKLFGTHGRRTLTSAAQSPTQRKLHTQMKLKRLLAPMAADCMIMFRGHSHVLADLGPCLDEVELYDDGKKIRQTYRPDSKGQNFIHPDHRYYFCTGSMLKLYGPMGVSGYAERGEYTPTELGYYHLTFANYELVEYHKVVV